jgi:hypothetical protein
LFQFTSHNGNMNCCYITDFCKSEVNFVLLLYPLLLKYWRISEIPDFQVIDFEKMVMERSWNFKWEKVYEPCICNLSYIIWYTCNLNSHSNIMVSLLPQTQTHSCYETWI